MAAVEPRVEQVAESKGGVMGRLERVDEFQCPKCKYRCGRAVAVAYNGACPKCNDLEPLSLKDLVWGRWDMPTAYVYKPKAKYA